MCSLRNLINSEKDWLGLKTSSLLLPLNYWEVAQRSHLLKMWKLGFNRGLQNLTSWKSSIWFWTLDVNRIASYEIALACLSVCLSVRSSVNKFSEDWIISFFWYYTYMMIDDHDIYWLTMPNFRKKKFVTWVCAQRA